MAYKKQTMNVFLLSWILLVLIPHVGFASVVLSRALKQSSLSELRCDAQQHWTQQEVPSAVFCLLLCKRDASCSGVFYNAVDRTCRGRGVGISVYSCITADNTEFYSLATCSDGYSLYAKGNFCYKIRSECTSWQGAVDICKQEGGNLIDLWDNQTAQDFMQLAGDVTTSTPGNCTFHGYWIGTTDLTVPGTWTWMDGREVDLSENWGPSQPNGPPEHCAMMYILDSNKYHDYTCTQTDVRYICAQQ